jgi:hypothetical protein
MKQFEVIKNNNPEKVVSRPFLVLESSLQHITNENLIQTHFKSTKSEARIVYVLKHDSKEYQLKFDFELIEETILLDFNGYAYNDEIRFIASEILEKMIEALRFAHKDKEWSISHYYIFDKEAYQIRIEPNYARSLANEWKKMRNKAEMEAKDPNNYFHLSSEDIHDLSLRAVGYDGYLLCETLKELNIIDYQKIDVNEYEMTILGNVDELERLKMKIAFVRELAKYGYNVFADYYEEV